MIFVDNLFSFALLFHADNIYGGNLDHLFSLVSEMSDEAHAEEGASYHPVTTSLYDNNLISTISTYDSLVPSLDIWSANVYRGNTFGTLFNDYKAVSQKPLAILEYGIDAFDNEHGNEYEKIGTPYQADYAEALWKEIESNSDACIGGTLMAYSDEWYKGEYSTDPGCPDNNAALQSTCGYPASSDPDGYCNEEWWRFRHCKSDLHPVHVPIQRIELFSPGQPTPISRVFRRRNTLLILSGCRCG